MNFNVCIYFQVEKFGELVAWRATDYFEAIIKTDLDKLTKLVHCFYQSTVDINHELRLLKIESKFNLFLFCSFFYTIIWIDFFSFYCYL